ncbi:LOW QUALITY PROTEIN: hypothetical protein PHMEG_00015298 [Phytophthora megakarya]|uniref:Uncharacterized protein n=1 Tax=Phytophthora megakarya TaxID=4795 RepID=A0A225W379_9STRA|nr:LOW QUALITY PROTEIN: hypothetical protein PHMEG_00015298 [Phytophthora megakarya]
MSMLILVAIKHAALDALKWILAANTPITAHLSDEESIECLQAAAKHPGVAYAEMTLLLLEHRFSPGRLSGDGMGIPLLHRVACFANTTLACQIMTMLLERPDIDVNALDAFGNTAITYALAAGRLHNVCFLIQNPKCRLEAEYEGQSCFYYYVNCYYPGEVELFSIVTLITKLVVAKATNILGVTGLCVVFAVMNLLVTA